MDTFPPLCFIRRRHQPPNTSVAGKELVLVTSTRMRPGNAEHDCLRFEIVAASSQYLAGARIEHYPYRNPVYQSIAVYRESSRPNATTLFQTEYALDSQVIVLSHGEQIPVVNLMSMAKVLPSTFLRIGDALWADRFRVVLPVTVSVRHSPPPSRSITPPRLVPPAPSRAEQSMPQHIVNMVIETALQKETTCPIEFEPLTKASARLTPCGHLVSHRAVECWLSNARSCPVCRSALQTNGLMEWKQ